MKEAPPAGLAEGMESRLETAMPLVLDHQQGLVQEHLLRLLLSDAVLLVLASVSSVPLEPFSGGEIQHRILSSYTAQRACEEPIVLTDHGQPVAVLLPLENTDLETVYLSSNRRFLELIERSRSRLRSEGAFQATKFAAVGAELRRRSQAKARRSRLASRRSCPMPVGTGRGARLGRRGSGRGVLKQRIVCRGKASLANSAMAAGVADRLWGIPDLVVLFEGEERGLEGAA